VKHLTGVTKKTRDEKCPSGKREEDQGKPNKTWFSNRPAMVKQKRNGKPQEKYKSHHGIQAPRGKKKFVKKAESKIQKLIKSRE